MIKQLSTRVASLFGRRSLAQGSQEVQGVAGKQVRMLADHYAPRGPMVVVSGFPGAGVSEQALYGLRIVEAAQKAGIDVKLPPSFEAMRKALAEPEFSWLDQRLPNALMQEPLWRQYDGHWDAGKTTYEPVKKALQQAFEDAGATLKIREWVAGKLEKLGPGELRPGDLYVKLGIHESMPREIMGSDWQPRLTRGVVVPARESLKSQAR